MSSSKWVAVHFVQVYIATESFVASKICMIKHIEIQPICASLSKEDFLLIWAKLLACLCLISFFAPKTVRRSWPVRESFFYFLFFKLYFQHTHTQKTSG